MQTILYLDKHIELYNIMAKEKNLKTSLGEKLII